MARFGRSRASGLTNPSIEFFGRRLSQSRALAASQRNISKDVATTTVDQMRSLDPSQQSDIRNLRCFSTLRDACARGGPCGHRFAPLSGLHQRRCFDSRVDLHTERRQTSNPPSFTPHPPPLAACRSPFTARKGRAKLSTIDTCARTPH